MPTKTKQPNPPTHEDDPILTCSEVGRQLGKSRQTIWRWVTDGLLEGIRLPARNGGHIGVRQSQVNDVLRSSAIGIQVKEPNE